MSTISRIFLIIGALLLAIAVQLGALGSHALADRLSPAELKSWDIAVQFQFFHSLGLVLIAILCKQISASRLLHWAGWLMLAGIFLFSGSIYMTALGAPEPLGMIAPFGGTSFMIAWILVAIAALKKV